MPGQQSLCSQTAECVYKHGRFPQTLCLEKRPHRKTNRAIPGLLWARPAERDPLGTPNKWMNQREVLSAGFWKQPGHRLLCLFWFALLFGVGGRGWAAFLDFTTPLRASNSPIVLVAALLSPSLKSRKRTDETPGGRAGALASQF